MVQAGDRFGHYTIDRLLGAGGMGQVFLAHDDRLGRDVALKVLPGEFVGDPEQLGRFRREALTLAALNHPNIATIHGFEEAEGGALALALERVEGETLAERIERGALAPPEAMHVCVQIAEALEVAHERGVAHRDLKPGNVMITPRGLVKVLDFGLAKQTGGLLGRPAGGEGGDSPVAGTGPAATATATLAPASGGAFPVTMHGTVVGTPGYMSPEQVLAGHQDHRTDLFAFGCVLFECLTGQRAFEGRDAFETMAKVMYDAVDLALLPERTPPRVRELLERCLEKDADQRLAEAKVARHELEEALGIRRAAAARAGEALATPHNLPAEVSSFVGRAAVLAECGRLLESTRLLTLTGMGGSGKTRIAQKLAEAAMDRFPDGVWFVDLVALRDPERVAEAVAAAAGVREEPGVPILRTLSEHLKERRTLLLLDNCEDLLDSCGRLAGLLLGGCPEVRIVATSREPLSVAGEVVHAVPPLAPPPEALDPAEISANECVQLFVERAAAVSSAFSLTPGTASAVAEICRRLDGIPLAIELAAARVRVLSVDDIRSRLGDRFKLLSAGGKAAIARHQTLRATIQWSVDHLHDDERALLRSLAVFVGAWTLESAVAAAGEDRDEFEVLDELSRLVDKSLVVVSGAGGGTTRYRYLESVRLFALELLAEAGEQPGARERHLAYFLTAAEASQSKLAGAEQGGWLKRLDAEHEDMLAAHAFCDSAENGPQRGLRIAAAMWRYWSVRGAYTLARRTLRDALARPGAEAPVAPRADALVRAGGFALLEGDYAAARPFIEQSLSVYRTLGDRKGVARGLSGLSVVAIFQREYGTARASSAESAALYRELGESHGAAGALHNLAYVEVREGDLTDAHFHYAEALALLEPTGDDRHIGYTLCGLAEVEARQGDFEAAKRNFILGIERLRPLGGVREIAYGLEKIAGWALTRGEPARAARWLGAAAAIRDRIGSPPLPIEAEEYEALQAGIAEHLGPEGLASALAEGRDSGPERGPAEALEWLQG